jgi:DNA-binding GntR family transcriptional regulator
MTAARNRAQPAADHNRRLRKRALSAAGATALLRNTAAPTPAVEEDGYASRSAFVYRKLRQAIERGELKPGERVMEVEVADCLDVSRTPVREALRRLESEGMLALEPRTGLVVASITRQAMLELYVMREVLEGTAARLCARHASDLELMELEELVKREARLHGNFEALSQHNKLFHQAVHRGAHNRFLEKSLAAVNDSMCLLGRSMMLLPQRAEEAQVEHGALAAAIVARDADAAEESARQHVRSAQKQRLKQLFPDSD